MKRYVLGPRAVVETLRARRDTVQIVLVADPGSLDAPTRNALDKANVTVELTPKRVLNDIAGTERHQGIVAVTGEYEYAELEDIVGADDSPFVIALDQITDPHNFGAIVRSAVAFGVHGIITLKDRAAPVTPTVVRASAGATEHARIARVTNLARTLRALDERGLQVVGLAGEAELELTELPGAGLGRVVVVGSEGKGLRRNVREKCTHLARIPMPGPIASLNASVASAIALYELGRAGDGSN